MHTLMISTAPFPAPSSSLNWVWPCCLCWSMWLSLLCWDQRIFENLQLLQWYSIYEAIIDNYILHKFTWVMSYYHYANIMFGHYRIATFSMNCVNMQGPAQRAKIVNVCSFKPSYPLRYIPKQMQICDVIMLLWRSSKHARKATSGPDHCFY